MVFVDGSNLYHGMKRAQIRFDLLRLAKYYVGKRKFIRCYYYGSLDPYDKPRIESQRKFIRLLNLGGIVTRIKPLRLHDGNKVEKGADVHLAVDLVSFALHGHYDSAILISGDEDFLVAVEAVKESGKIVEIAYFSEQISDALRLSADEFHDLNNVPSEILRNRMRKI